MRSVFAIVALAALSSAQRANNNNNRPNNVANNIANNIKNPNLPLVTLTATETVTVTSCPPITTVCGKTITAKTTTTSKAQVVVTTTTTTTSPAKGSSTTLATTTKAPTTTTKAPTPSQSCFRIQARSQNRAINNAYLDSPSAPDALIQFTSNPSQAGIYTLDSSSQLRNARTGTVASRALLGRTSYGPVLIATPGRRTTDDKVTCSADKGALKCSAAGGASGSLLYSRANNLFIARDANVPRDMSGVELLVWSTVCPAGMPKL